MLWYPMVQLRENGGLIGRGNPQTLSAKYRLATGRAIAACDARDGVVDGVLDDPRQCDYLASADPMITQAACAADNAQCLTPSEAAVIDSSWRGPVHCPQGGASCKVPDVASRSLKAKRPQRLWYGQPRGTDLATLGGAAPFPVAIEQTKFWVYLDPDWDWHPLDYGNFLTFFRDTVDRVGPLMASDNPDLDAFRRRGGKLVLWHGWVDQLINAQGTIDYYERVVKNTRRACANAGVRAAVHGPGWVCAGGGVRSRSGHSNRW
jgi:hypothetical protein